MQPGCTGFRVWTRLVFKPLRASLDVLSQPPPACFAVHYFWIAPLPLHLPDIEILTPVALTEFADARQLFIDYAKHIGVDLCFQDFEAELAALPGEYAEPTGPLRLGRIAGQWAGCCALRPITSVDYPDAAEMKRLYVRPAFRGLGLGRRLAESVMDAARVQGYRSVLLDTLDDMEMARALYGEPGFSEIPPYYHNPIAGAHHLKVDL